MHSVQSRRVGCPKRLALPFECTQVPGLCILSPPQHRVQSTHITGRAEDKRVATTESRTIALKGFLVADLCLVGVPLSFQNVPQVVSRVESAKMPWTEGTLVVFDHVTIDGLRCVQAPLLGITYKACLDCGTY